METRFFLWTFVAAVLLLSGTCSAQDYRLGPGDVLEIRFWQDPNLNATVRVGQDGKITLDVIGQVDVGDKTVDEARQEIVKLMSRLNNRISQATVRVLEYQYQHVFVQGQILVPGKHAFEQIPDLWTIINEAGGVTEFGDLRRVTIVRGGDDAGQVEVVDMLEAIETGRLSSLPKIRRRDAIEIPRRPIGLPSGEIGRTTAQRNVIYVIGAVNTPGPIQFQENVDIMEALALAGGPTPEADLEKARVITKDGYYAQTLHVNLEKYAEKGIPARYIMKKEDTFVLPHRRGPFLGVGLGGITAILGLVSMAIIIYDQLSPADEPAPAVR